jgi:hypothetical protein
MFLLSWGVQDGFTPTYSCHVSFSALLCRTLTTFEMPLHLSVLIFPLRLNYFLRFEVFRAVTIKNTLFWDVASCRYCINRRFGGTHRLHLQGRRKIREGGTSVSRWLQTKSGSSLADFFYSTLKMEAIRSSETSDYTISTRRHIPEDGSLQIIFEFDCVYVVIKCTVEL